MTPLQIDVLGQFRALGIRNLIVGGQAMRAWGIDRQTRDLDLWIARDRANAEAMTRFLQRVQNRPPLERLQQPNFRFTVGDPRRPEVDILTSLAGDPEFDACLAHAQELVLDGLRVTVISAEDLLAVKEASAAIMDRDAADQNLSAAERTAATATAGKERRDIAMIQRLLRSRSASPSADAP
jgi:nucleotidyltransferase DUF2204